MKVLEVDTKSNNNTNNTNNNSSYWKDIQDSLHNEFGDNIYNSWLSKLNFVSYNSYELCLSVETSFIKEWITKEFLNGKKRKINGEYIYITKGIKQVLLEQFNIKSITIIVDDTINTNANTNNYINTNTNNYTNTHNQNNNNYNTNYNTNYNNNNNSTNNTNYNNINYNNTNYNNTNNTNNNIISISEYDNIYTIGTELNKLYTFDNYVVGESNKLAYSIARTIINSLNTNTNTNTNNINNNITNNNTTINNTANTNTTSNNNNQSITNNNTTTNNNDNNDYNNTVINNTNANTTTNNTNTLNFDINPFFLYSEVGLGKTHLMQAMAWEFKERYKDKNVVYLTAEKFMFLFVQSLKNNNINTFKDKFRNIDILLIDDIQFIAGKDGTQKEFFYTFNTLLSDNKKIILACNKAPDNMENIDIQLKSRLSSGIVVDILKPDYNMRLELAKKKAEVLGLQCKEEVFEYIAENITTTNRDIEGTIKKLLIYQKFMNNNNLITLDIAKKVLKDTLNTNKKVITIDKIQQKVAEYYKITKTELLSDKRDRKYSLPRQIAFYLSKKITQKSYPEIAREFNNKNHATVIFAYNKIEKELQSNIEMIDDIKNIEKMV